jgi:hypothetical protein
VKRWYILVIAVVLLFGIATGVGYRVALHTLQGRVENALGQGTSVEDLKVNWFSIELIGLSIKAPQGWPAARTLQAQRVKMFPSLLSLLTDKIYISSIIVEGPYLTVMRVPGKLIMVPSLAESADRKNAEANSSRRGVTIAKVELQDGVLELFDSTVSRPPLKTRFEQIDGVIRDISSPSSGTKTEFDLAAIVKGIRSDGRARVSGWFGPARRDSSSQIALDAVDLVSLQPYLAKKNEARVSKGTMDLKLDSEVRDNKMDGKGKVILRDVEFAPARGFLDTFMGIPRSAVISFLKDHNNAIDLDFTLQGDANHPKFSLNETLATRMAAAMAGRLGVNIRGVTEGVGTLSRQGAESAKGVAEGVGSALRGLFGGTKK